MLTMRRRGKNGIYYFRGSVTLGRKRIDVKDFSAGTSDADAASHLIAQYKTNLRNELMFGASAKLVDATIADAFNSYLSKTPPPCPSDVLRVGTLNQIIGDMKLNYLHDSSKRIMNAWSSDPMANVARLFKPRNFPAFVLQ